MSIRIQRIEAEIQQLKILPHLSLITCQPDDLIRNDLWIIWVNGQKGSLYENGKYPVRITFPDKYPLQPPKVQFQKDFLHVHVYEGGLICLPLLEQINWRSKVSMAEVIRRIDALIHQDINPYSPANMTVFQMYRNNKEKYQQTIKSQAEKYKQKRMSYFLEPCLHIQILEKLNQ